MRPVLLALAIAIAGAAVGVVASPDAQQVSYSPVQDGEPHGDPPYLLEDGWQPLLNGADLDGWKSCDPATKNEWFTTRSVRFEKFLGPTQLNGRPAASGVIMNGRTGERRVCVPIARLATSNCIWSSCSRRDRIRACIFKDSTRSRSSTASATRAHLPIAEGAANPIMLEGDHGPVAFRNIYVRPLRPIITR